MKKHSVCILFFCICSFCYSKEWCSLKSFQKETGLLELTNSDWLKSDRKQKTQVWENANVFNLNNQLSSDYETIVQRRDFYEWYYESMEEKGHEVVWPKMAHYISKRLRLTKIFPFSILTKKEVKQYAYQGSEQVFNQGFEKLKSMYNSTDILKNESALQWDKEILYLEQYFWIQDIYTDIDDNTLKTISKMAKGKGFYSLLVPKEIRFHGDISNTETRYQYALETLRNYCQKRYQ